MESYDYYAVTYSGTCYCLDCVPANADLDETTPIFADSEWSYYPTCDKCGYVHDYITLITTE